MRPCVTRPLIVRGTEFGGAKPLFCVPLVAQDLKELLAQAEIARQLEADVVEWRADSFLEFSVDSIVEAAQALRHVLDREPILFTPRIRSEGGAGEIAEDVRLQCTEARFNQPASTWWTSNCPTGRNS